MNTKIIAHINGNYNKELIVVVHLAANGTNLRDKMIYFILNNIN